MTDRLQQDICPVILRSQRRQQICVDGGKQVEPVVCIVSIIEVMVFS